VLGLLVAGVQQLPNQDFEALPQPVQATVGDTVTVVFRVRLDPVDLLYDTVPHPVSALPEGVRVLQIERLRRAPDRTFTGRARLAYFRVGRQPVPAFGLDFMRGVKGMTRATLVSDSAFVMIDSVAPPGSPTLKDIREPASQTGVSTKSVLEILALAGSAGLVVLYRRRPQRSQTIPFVLELPAAVETSALERALEELDRIEQAGWAAHGEVPRHYAGVADVVRRYLSEAYGLPAPTSTTSELARLLPDGMEVLREQYLSLLQEADLVKFARTSRSEGGAAEYLRQARAVLAQP